MIKQTASNLFFQFSKLTRRIGQRLSPEMERLKMLKDWNLQDIKKHFRTNYPSLEETSTVFDLGGYKGQWASDIYSQYLCRVFIFEPHPEYAKNITTRFQKNPKLTVFPFGLGGKTETLILSTEEESSTTFGDNKNGVSIKIREVTSFFEEHKVEQIALMKVNIEGGEYDLLDHLLDQDWTVRIENLQIQFHHFVPNATARMKRIQERLAETHHPTYLYPFFWENWELKKEAINDNDRQ